MNSKRTAQQLVAVDSEDCEAADESVPLVKKRTLCGDLRSEKDESTIQTKGTTTISDAKLKIHSAESKKGGNDPEKYKSKKKERKRQKKKREEVECDKIEQEQNSTFQADGAVATVEDKVKQNKQVINDRKKSKSQRKKERKRQKKKTEKVKVMSDKTEQEEAITFVDGDKTEQEQATALVAGDKTKQEQATALVAGDKTKQEQATALVESDKREQEQATALVESDKREQEQATALVESDKREQEQATALVESDKREQEQATALVESDKREQEQATALVESDKTKQEQATDFVDDDKTEQEQTITFVDDDKREQEQTITFVDGDKTEQEEKDREEKELQYNAKKEKDQEFQEKKENDEEQMKERKNQMVHIQEKENGSDTGTIVQSSADHKEERERGNTKQEDSNDLLLNDSRVKENDDPYFNKESHSQNESNLAVNEKQGDLSEGCCGDADTNYDATRTESKQYPHVDSTVVKDISSCSSSETSNAFDINKNALSTSVPHTSMQPENHGKKNAHEEKGGSASSDMMSGPQRNDTENSSGSSTKVSSKEEQMMKNDEAAEKPFGTNSESNNQRSHVTDPESSAPKVEVVFHVIISKIFGLDTETDVALISLPGPDAGKTDGTRHKMNFQRQTEVGWLYTVKIPVREEDVSRGFSYRYLVIKHNDKPSWELVLKKGQDDQKQEDVCRQLRLEDVCTSTGDIHWYDGVAYPASFNNTLSTIKRGLRLTTLSAMVQKDTVLSGKEFLPCASKIKEAICSDTDTQGQTADDYLSEIQTVIRSLRLQLLDSHLCNPDPELVRMCLWKYLVKPLLDELSKKPKQAVSLAMFVAMLVKSWEISLRPQFRNILCNAMLPSQDMERKKCPDLDASN